VSLIHLAAVAGGFIAAGTVLVCAAHIPGLRVIVGAQPLGLVPSAQDERDVADALHDVADVLTAHAVTDGLPTLAEQYRVQAARYRERARGDRDLAQRAAWRHLTRGLDDEAAELDTTAP
jgi:flagellar motor component MotA